MIKTSARYLALGAMAGSILGIWASASWAVPYASAVRALAVPNMWEFVLNENASSVTILRDGGNALTIPNAPLGRHSFDMTGFSDFEIQVNNSAAAGWTQISDSSDLFTNFERPSGLAVNNNPASQYFGTIYVNQSTDFGTVSGRSMADGIYPMTADRKGVNLSTFGAIADPQDTTQAVVPPGWNVTGSSNSAWRMALDDAGNLIVSDWSDANGGIKYASPDLTTGGLILDQQAGPTYGVINGNNEPIHGSIVSKPIVTGSVGNNLTVWAMDEDLESTFLANDGNSVWRWDVGNATDYDGAPQLVINSSNLGDNSEGGTNFLNLNVGVLANAHYNATYDKWYLTQNRFDGNESGLVIVSADGSDGNSPTVDWSSGQFSIDNALDSWLDDALFPGSIGTQDIFRYSGSVTISPDGTKLFLHKTGQPAETVTDASGNVSDYDNRYLGRNSNLPGAVLVIPLDANGLPVINVDDNGTPGDPLDDFITNLESIELGANNNNYHSRQEVALDAAGNLYVTNNISELMEVWSPGGNTRAITTSAGTFDLQMVTGLACDFDGNGSCDLADIDALVAAIASGSTDLTFDLNGDGLVTRADVNDATSGWLTQAGAENTSVTGGNPYLEGDADLDGSVDVSDFNLWNSNKFTASAAWSTGDFTADGTVDVSDFNVWNGNKFNSSAAAAVPEPSAFALASGLLLGVGLLRRRR